LLGLLLNFKKNSKGQALLEAALTAPLIVFFLFTGRQQVK